MPLFNRGKSEEDKRIERLQKLREERIRQENLAKLKRYENEERDRIAKARGVRGSSRFSSGKIGAVVGAAKAADNAAMKFFVPNPKKVKRKKKRRQSDFGLWM